MLAVAHEHICEIVPYSGYCCVVCVGCSKDTSAVTVIRTRLRDSCVQYHYVYSIIIASILSLCPNKEFRVPLVHSNSGPTNIHRNDIRSLYCGQITVHVNTVNFNT